MARWDGGGVLKPTVVVAEGICGCVPPKLISIYYLINLYMFVHVWLALGTTVTEVASVSCLAWPLLGFACFRRLRRAFVSCLAWPSFALLFPVLFGSCFLSCLAFGACGGLLFPVLLGRCLVLLVSGTSRYIAGQNDRPSTPDKITSDISSSCLAR